MKTKLYSLLTGLLMAACFMSYGQEIVGTLTTPATSFYGGIVETSDGGFLIGCCTNLYNREYMVYKVAPEGAFLDSVRFPGIYDMLEVPSEPDLTLLYGYEIEANFYQLTLTLIDDNLNVVNEASIPIGEYDYDFWDGFVFVSPNGEILFPYSVNMNDVLHIMRIALDGTVLEDKAFDEIPCGTWDSEGTNDSMVYYSDVNVFTESPLTYNCLGIYKNAEDTTIVVNRLMDENLNLIETIEYASYDPDAIFGPEGFTFVSTLGAEASTRKTYLSTSMRMHNMTTSTIIRYDSDNHPDAWRRFTSYSQPGYLVAKEENSLYFTYSSNYRISLYRLDGDLNTLWHTTLPSPTSAITSIHTMKTFKNGDLVVGYSIYEQGEPYANYCIVHDNTLDGMDEPIHAEKPFELYPNPTKGTITLRFTKNEPTNVEVYDLTGRLMITKTNGLERLDMSAMPTGVYMLHVTMKDGISYNEKILKE